MDRQRGSAAFRGWVAAGWDRDGRAARIFFPAFSIQPSFQLGKGEGDAGSFPVVVAIVVDAAKDVFGLGVADFGKDRFDHQGRRENLFEAVLEGWAERETDQAAQGDVFGGAIEAFEMGGFDGGLADFLDVDRMTERGEGVAIINLEDLGHALADAEKENAFGT